VVADDCVIYMNVTDTTVATGKAAGTDGNTLLAKQSGGLMTPIDIYGGR